ncbi:MAG: glycerol kinase GlpK [Bradymonadales bacterium]|jgi:glycerol kinase
MTYLMAIDQGTTSTTVVIIDEKLQLCSSSSKEFTQIYPQSNYVEHKPDEIWQSVLEAVGESIAKARINAKDIAALGITNQRETCIIWDRKTGKPVYNAIVWQCRRTADYCATLKAQGHEALIKEKTGLLLDPYFSASKIRWILDELDLQKQAENGELCFGTIDCYLLWQLSGAKVFATDPSNASRTLLMNLQTQTWDPELCELFNIPTVMLPEIKENAATFAHSHGVPGLPNGIPITGMAGDQQAALFGQCCFQTGTAKCTFGTGSFLLLNTGNKIVRSQHGLLSTLAWKLGSQSTYALEGSTFVAGALVQWLRDGLGIIQDAAQVEALARSVPDNSGITIVPAFTGLGAPHWKPHARGVITGITRATTSAHIARAALEAISHQNTDLLQAMLKDLGHPLISLKVDGGASANDLLMQIQSDYLDCTLERPQILQTTALGAAMLAGLGSKIFSDLASLQKSWKVEERFEPKMGSKQRFSARAQWSAAIEKSF